MNQLEEEKRKEQERVDKANKMSRILSIIFAVGFLVAYIVKGETYLLSTAIVMCVFYFFPIAKVKK